MRSAVQMLGAFVLGACATAGVSAVGATSGGSQQATIVTSDAAETRTAPSGKAVVRFLARGDNAFIGLLTMDALAAVPEHRDASEEYIHVLEGAGTITIDGDVSEISAGTTVYMPANAQVSFQNGPEMLVGLQVFSGPGPAAKYDAWKTRE